MSQGPSPGIPLVQCTYKINKKYLITKIATSVIDKTTPTPTHFRLPGFKKWFQVEFPNSEYNNCLASSQQENWEFLNFSIKNKYKPSSIEDDNYILFIGEASRPGPRTSRRRSGRHLTTVCWAALRLVSTKSTLCAPSDCRHLFLW